MKGNSRCRLLVNERVSWTGSSLNLSTLWNLMSDYFGSEISRKEVKACVGAHLSRWRSSSAIARNLTLEKDWEGKFSWLSCYWHKHAKLQCGRPAWGWHKSTQDLGLDFLWKKSILWQTFATWGTSKCGAGWRKSVPPLVKALQEGGVSLCRDSTGSCLCSDGNTPGEVPV